MLQSCAVISASFSSTEHFSAAQCPQLRDLPELQLKEPCHAGDHSITHWGISCSLKQFWPQGCSWKRKLQLRAGITALLFMQRIQTLDFLKAQEGQWQSTAYVCNSKLWLAARSNPSPWGHNFHAYSAILDCRFFFVKTQNRTWNTT